MGIYMNGIFINSEQRFKDGKADGYNILVAVGSNAYKVKASDELYYNLPTLRLGQTLSCMVSITSFRERIYFTALNIEVIEN